MSRLHKLQVRAQDSQSVDAFGRWRGSNPVPIFDSKQLFDNLPLFWDEALESGAGITSAWSQDTASTVITSTAVTAGVFTRQTFMRFNYQPGKSQLIYMTGVLLKSGGGVGVEIRLGIFDDNNGLFFASIEGVTHVVLRSSVSGAPVDDAVPQSSWNIDPMDGTGPSGVIVDWTRVQIFCIDYQWLGAGRVRMCLNFGGVSVLVHEFLTANVLASVFMSTPNLPLRYQIKTTGASPESSIEAICSSVISEGGAGELGSLRYISTGGAHVGAATENIIYAVVGMRLKTSYLGAGVILNKVSIAEHVGSKEYEWLLIRNPVVAGVFTYNPATESSVEVALGATANTVTGGFMIGGGLSSSAKQGGSQTGEVVPDAIRLGAAIDGTRDTMVLCVRPIGGSTGLNVEGGITYRELS